MNESIYYILQCQTFEQAQQFLKEHSKSKKGYRNGRAFNFMCYLDESSIQRCICQNRRKIRSYGYILHDKDTDDNGCLKEPHYHGVIRTYSQFTLYQFYSWFKPYLFELNEETKQFDKKINLVPEFTSDLQMSVNYLTHKDNPEKFQYSVNDIMSDDLQDLSCVVDKCYDSSYDLVNDIIDGKTELELLKKYGREYVYHRTQYRELAYQIRYSYVPIKQRLIESDVNDVQESQLATQKFIPYTYTDKDIIKF